MRCGVPNKARHKRAVPGHLVGDAIAVVVDAIERIAHGGKAVNQVDACREGIPDERMIGREPAVDDRDDNAGADLAALRQRLDLIQLALQTGAPLSTAEVSALLGARPGGDVVERGGLRARRLSRNVWKLSRVEESSGFNDGFRRRL